MAYTNAERLIDQVRACSRDLSNSMNRARALHAESIRVGGESRLSPYFFELDPETGLPTSELRIDLQFSLTDLNLALSAMQVLSAGASPVEGMAAQVDAAWASLDKIKL